MFFNEGVIIMENLVFNNILSFDENNEFERVNEKTAIESFFTCSDSSIKESFLEKFANYIKRGLEEKKFPNDTMQDLMFTIFYLYDDPYPLLIQFNELIENISSCNNDRINFNGLDKITNQCQYIKVIRNIISDIEHDKSYSDLNLSSDFKKKLIKYRNDIEFNRKKDALLSEYGSLDEQELKKSFEYYISKEYKKDGTKKRAYGFLEGFNNISDKCNRYETYRQAYTYSLKKYGDEETRKLFQPSAHKYVVAICEGNDLNDFLSLKRAITLESVNLYDLSLTLFGSSEQYQDCLKELFDKVNNSIGKDFEPVVVKYQKDELQYIMETVDFQSFLTSNCKSIKEYCERKNIDISLFKKGLLCLKDQVLLRQIEEKKQKLATIRFAPIASKIDKIVEYIMNGIQLDDNTTREFDYLDYKLMTKLEFNDFKKIACKCADANIVRAVSKFIGKNNKNSKTNVRSILQTQTIVGYGTDKEHEITEEEKLATIEFLKHNHLISNNGTVDSKIYNIALKRYLTGTLFDEKYNNTVNHKS